MPHSPSPSRTSAAALAALALGAAAPLGLGGCGDDACGPGGAPAAGLVASSDAVALTYGGLTGLLGNDCPEPGAPEGVISLSVEGRQEGAAGLVTFCIPRPDLLMEGDRTLGTAASNADVRIIDLTGTLEDCTFSIDSSRLPTGTAQATGVCQNGDSPDGFALSFDGAVALRRTCSGVVDSISVTLRGRVAVGRRGM